MTDHVRALIAWLMRQQSKKAARGVRLHEVLARMIGVSTPDAWKLCLAAEVKPETMIVKTLKLM